MEEEGDRQTQIVDLPIELLDGILYLVSLEEPMPVVIQSVCQTWRERQSVWWPPPPFSFIPTAKDYESKTIDECGSTHRKFGSHEVDEGEGMSMG